MWNIGLGDSRHADVALESCMSHIFGLDRSQLLLLLEAIDDYVAADNPVRFIDAFVDGLDLKAAGFDRVEAKATVPPRLRAWQFVKALCLRQPQSRPVEPAIGSRMLPQH